MMRHNLLTHNMHQLHVVEDEEGLDHLLFRDIGVKGAIQNELKHGINVCIPSPLQALQLFRLSRNRQLEHFVMI